MTGRIFAHEGDVFEFLNQVEDESVDGVITDLPYPTTERHRLRGTTTRTKESASSSNPWYEVMSLEDLSRVLDEFYRVLKPDSYAFCFVDYDTAMLLAFMRGVTQDLFDLVTSGKPTSRAPRDAVGFGWRTPSTWVKTTGDSTTLQSWFDAQYGKAAEAHLVEPPHARWNGHDVVKLNPGTGYHGAACTEKILCLQKGNAQAVVKWRNAFLAPRPTAKPEGAILKAASPKPPHVVEVLTRACSHPGGLILDPFIGCGTHALGITNAGCDALINDRNLALALDHLGNAHNREIQEW